MVADNLPNLTRLKARDTMLVLRVGGLPGHDRRLPRAHGWADWPWYTTVDDFSADFDVDRFGINVFVRDGDESLALGETRTQTGDTTIFRQMPGTLELGRNPPAIKPVPVSVQALGLRSARGTDHRGCAR